MNATDSRQATAMLYNLSDPVPPGKNLAYALQHLIYFLAGCVVIPVAVGNALRLGQAEIASMLQRTFVLSGIVSILQTRFGHGYPMVDGPAGLWMGVIVAMASTVESSGGSLAALCASLELGMMIGGGVLILLAAAGLVNRFASAFTPIINGTLMILITVQLSGSVMKNAVGATGEGTSFQGKSLLVFLLTVAIIILINFNTTGFIRSIATLIGVAVGWGFSILVGLPSETMTMDALISLPKPFAWGVPALDASVLLTCVICSLVLISNCLISITGVEAVVDEPMTPQKLRRSTALLGVSTALCGIFPTVGYCPFSSSMGVITMTRVAARKPFYLGGAFIILLGLIAPVGSFFATLPPAVGYGATMVTFSLIFSQGIQEFRKVDFSNREGLIVGTSLIIGAGVMFLPSTAFAGLPDTLRYIISNGLVDGFLVCFLLENVILRKKAAA